MKQLIYSLLIIGVLFSGCEDSNETRPYPRVRTLDVTNITSEGALFQGEITTSTVKIIDHGFVWAANANPRITTDETSSLGETATGKFGHLVERSLEEGKKYFVRAYAKSDDYTVYGDVVEFVSLGSKAPVIKHFSPARANVLDTVIITGSYFSNVASKLQVKFDTFVAKVVSVNDTSVVVIVPKDLNKIMSTISISLIGNIALSPTQFELLGPELTSVSSLTIKACDTLVIKGTNISTATGAISVSLNGQSCQVISTTSSQIKVKVPLMTSSDAEVDLRVKYFSLEEIFPQKLSYNHSKIIDHTSLKNIHYEDEITFSGEYLAMCEHVALAFNGITTGVSSRTATELVFIVPDAVTSFSGTCSILFAGNNIYSAEYSFEPPKITAISPGTATYGDVIIITGKNFNPTGQHSSVTIGGAHAEILSGTSTTLEVKISDESGLCELTENCNAVEVTVGGVTVARTDLFTLKAPVIEEISTTELQESEIVTITGQYFSPVLDYNVVRVGSHYFRPTFASTTLLEFSIDRSCASNGNQYLSSVRVEEVQVKISRYVNDTPSLLTSNAIDATVRYYGPWTKLSPFPGDMRRNEVGFMIGNKLYYGMGNRNADYQYLKDFWEYDLSTNKWKQLNDFAGDTREFATYWDVNNVGYVGAGKLGSTVYNDFWKFDPSNNTWSKAFDFPMENKLIGYSTVLYGTVYTSLGQYKNFWKLDVNTQTWTQLKDLPFDARILFSSQTTIYAVLAETNGSDGSRLFQYDREIDEWTLIRNGGGDFTSSNGEIFLVHPTYIMKYDAIMDEFMSTGSPTSSNHLKPFMFSADYLYFFIIDNQLYQLDMSRLP